MFKIISTGYGAGGWARGCLNSIAAQTHHDYDVLVIDDATPDLAYQRQLEEFCARHGWTCQLNDQRRGAMYNQVHGIRSMNCDDDDVIIWVDTDDHLAHEHVLAQVASYYADGRTQLTYGSYVNERYHLTGNPAMPYPLEVIAANDYRRFALTGGGILFNHLRTVKHELFAELLDDDFMDMDGNWFKTCCDAAIMIPCLELANGNFKYITDILYVYNSSNPISEWRKHPRQIDSDNDWILRAKFKKR